MNSVNIKNNQFNPTGRVEMNMYFEPSGIKYGRSPALFILRFAAVVAIVVGLFAVGWQIYHDGAVGEVFRDPKQPTVIGAILVVVALVTLFFLGREDKK